MKILYVILVVYLQYSCISQQQVNRSAQSNTLEIEYDSTSTLFAESGFWGEMQKGFGSEADAMNSNIRFGGLFQFHRWENSALDFTLSFELTADPNNNISFNPRSARWQEELFYSQKQEWGIWSLGLMHRCKHEIDNFDPEDAGTTDLTYRVLLSSGPFFAYQNETEIKNWNFNYHARLDYTLLKGDWRWEDNSIPPSWDELLGELSLTFRSEHKTFKYMNIYSRHWLNFMQFKTSTEFNYRGELGTRFFQKANSIQIYLAYETLYDDLMLNIPRSNNIIYLGFRATSLIFW